TLEHPLGEVDADDFPCARLAGCDRKVARPTTGVEDAVARPDRLAHRRPAPALVETRRHDPVHRVVDRRDAVEHPLHAFGRQAAGFHRHVACPQRGVSAWSSPIWSRARATTKSTRFSTVSAPW